MNITEKIEFLDAEGHKARLDVSITDRNGYPEFTVSGSFLGSFGQCDSNIKPANDSQAHLMKLWKEYHLKDISTVADFSKDLMKTLSAIREIELAREVVELSGDDLILSKMEEEGIDDDMLEACKAYIALGIESDNGLENFQEAYCGQFSDDEEFAQDMAENTGAIVGLDDMHWPLRCIDWEQASRELMYDYSEEGGYYFRNI